MRAARARGATMPFRSRPIFYLMNAALEVKNFFKTRPLTPSNELNRVRNRESEA